MESRFAVRKSKFGKCIFATKRIKKGETVCFLKGKAISTSEVKRLYETGKERRGDPLQIEDDEYIDLDEPYVCINHSCNPNAHMRGRNELVAIRNIGTGGEITFDYSTTMWDEKWSDFKEPKWSMKCRCGNRNCRGVIKDFPTLPKEIKDKYLKGRLLPDFILKKIGF